MRHLTERSPSHWQAVSASSNHEGGFTLVEVLICTLILTTGMLGIAGLLGVTTTMQFDAREAARSTRLAQEKIDELMKLDFDTDADVAIGGNADVNAAGYFDQPLDGITVRWEVAAQQAPEGCAIKGNIDRDGERIYHTPWGSQWYERTEITEVR